MDRIEKTLSLGASLGCELVELARTLEDRDVPEPASIGALAAACHGCALTPKRTTWPTPSTVSSPRESTR
jgi:hypothetical protein